MLILFLSVCLAAGSAQILQDGRCDTIASQSNFDLEKFTGRWYGQRGSTALQHGDCSYIDIVPASSGNYEYKVDISYVEEAVLKEVTGTAVVEGSSANFKLTLEGINTDFNVVITDYDNYALVYSCENIGEKHRSVYIWQLAREPSFSDEAVRNLVEETVSSNFGLTVSDLSVAVQSEALCNVEDFSESVILSGQCDENIPVVDSLDLQLFAGEWRLISSYYNERQAGECNRAIYTVQGTGLSVQNIHVLNRELLTVSGTAAFASNETNGKLNVTIGSNTFNYWILATDYSSYALVYGCESLENNQQRIYSWILGRSNILSEEENANINRTIDSIAVLDNSLYIPADQSDAACFYYPEIQPNQPVIFSGRCSQNITTTTNFDLQTFSGEWRLISSYYNERQSGDCNRVLYAAQGDDSFSVQNSHVVNGSLVTATGTARFASTTDRDGKFLVTIGTNTIDYWILTTDYSSYALAYSCHNLTNNQYRVDSWKLSRTNSLDASTTEEFNRVYDRVPTLNDRFFQDVNQSDSACFYMPDVDSSKPVVFRGQCDQTIPVTTNFNATQYMGQWYDIESYPSNWQSGTCNSAFYSLRGSFVDVVNTQVVDQAISVRQGVGSFVENEQIAKLSLNFGSSTLRDYWVLSTDHSTYALVYSCLNVDSQNMQVGAWKLSRNTQLTQSVQTAIDNVMATIDVLDSRYFIQRNHTSAGCTYETNIQSGDPVILSGTCPTNLLPVSNFDLTSFAGTWHEIDAYPIDLWAGQCSSQQFAAVGNDSLSFFSRAVRNKELVEVNGTATRIAGTNDGLLTIAVETDSGILNVPFTVLSVNYTDYALAYGCVQITDNLRRVYSWKLSRNTELSNNANTAINTIVMATPDLVNSYYVNVDHSTSGCFYIPDIPLGQEVVFPGQCDMNLTVVSQLNLESFLGRWRVIASYYTHRQSGECNRVTYATNGSTISVTNQQVQNSELGTVTGTATVAADGSGKLQVSISTRTVDFWILDTDYDSYALAYSCRNVNTNEMRIYSWKLSRNTTLTEAAETAINSKVNEIDVLNDRFYSETDNSNEACFYYPTVNPSEPVIFEGQCDQNISVVGNFQASSYIGVWYDIESYPSTFQYGTCNTATYNASGNTLLVTNTQIIDGAISEREATAVFTEGNTVGKLRLNFGSDDRDYWILGTDYTTYSLVYSCVNLDATRKQVGTWKLSRTRQLAQRAQTEINTIMSSIRELDQRYFIQRNHTDAGCFYHRDQTEIAVVFSGTCDTTISAVANFNLTAFQGVWHEIEAYPNEMLSGECVSQEYSQVSVSTLNLVQRRVQHETQLQYTGIASRPSNDSSGQLLINVQGDLGGTIPFWILSTDYTNYALAYGCVNLNETQRQVYSWKLSRQQQLSTAAVTAISIAKAEIAVLDSRYYRTINQSDAACFHLPEISPGESVILPGQCDANIPVVMDFDAQRYSGTWYQVEKYYQRFEINGNCTGARYTLNSDTGVVTVLNWQVVNGVLDTIEGTATVTSNDGSAKLTVRLPIRSSDPNNPEFTEASLYVLDTDYTSYSLAYSCANLEGNRRQIGAWKLSRARTMSNNGNTAINTYMASRPELSSIYFIPVDQSDSCSEPNSATLVKNSIIVLAILCLSLAYLS